MHNEWIAAIGHKGVIGLLKAVGALPRSLANGCGDAFGMAIYALDRRHRKIAFSNLARSYRGEMDVQAVRQLNRAVFRNIGRIPFEIGRSLIETPEQTTRRMTVRGRRHLDRARQKGRGVLLLTAHLGNWEMAPAAYFCLGGKGAVVYRPLDQPALDRAFKTIRSRWDTRLIPNRRAMREILRALRDGRLVGLLMDQNVDWYEGVFARFFGRRACTNKGLALLALKTRAPVVPIFLLRTRDGFEIDVQPPVRLQISGDKTRDVEANTQLFNTAIEAAVRRHPEQWFWVHQRWKTRPSQPWPRRGDRLGQSCAGAMAVQRSA
jgi:KDO2-lipid IV(A) lauroyltransferase